MVRRIKEEDGRVVEGAIVGKETIEHTLTDETPPILEVSIDGVFEVVTEFFDDSNASQVDEVSGDNHTVVEEPIGTEASRSMTKLSDDNHMQLASEHVLHVGLSMEEGVQPSFGITLNEVLGDTKVLDDGHTQ